MSTTIARDRFEIGKVLKLTFSSLQRNLVPFVFMGLIFAGAPALVTGLLSLNVAVAPAAIGGPLALGLLAWTLAMAGGVLLQAGVIHGVLADLNGKKASFAEIFSTAIRLVGPLLLLALIQSVAYFVAAIAFLIPALVLMCYWAVAVAARVVEGQDWKRALARSADLTAGRRWSIFGLFVIIGLGAIVVSLAFGAIGSGAPLGAISGAIAQTVVAVVGAAMSAALYYELRRTKEGIGAEQMASVFD